MNKINEKKFYDSLERIFTGAKIEGDSGYINLLKIKANYYKKILTKFKNQVNDNQIINQEFKEEFFDKLYTFFEKYFSESGSVYFVKTAHYQKVYEQVYTDNKDLILFWKTHMLYYVKSDILFQNMDIELKDEKQNKYNFHFDVGQLKAKQNNEKKEIIFQFTEIKTENNNFFFDVSYSEKGKKTKINDIVKQTKINEDILYKAFATFKKQSEVDFFINKNANKFLTEQLDFFLHQILMNEENKFQQNRLDQLKILKEFALKIIHFVAQFEDELVKIWNKPKFALRSNYVVTIDKLSQKIIQKIKKHPKIHSQVKEWKELEMIENDFNFEDFDIEKNIKYKFLPIDTKFFKDLEIEILNTFENIDEDLDGRLIHSENYQALNTIKEKFKKKIQCIYIDPPFNTGSDFAYVDKFQDSTWLSLMHDRITIAKDFLNDKGSFFLHLDQNADYKGRFILDNIFGKENFINEIAWCYTGPTSPGMKKFNQKFDIIFWYSKKLNNWIFNIKDIRIPFKDPKQTLRKAFGEDLSQEKIEEYRNRGKIPETWWSDITIAVRSSQNLHFSTQKPEQLLERIIKTSSCENNFILDFFSGSGSTVAVAHKLSRKWLGVEMGDHFESVILPRMKKVVFGKISGISKSLKAKELKKGGFFKYYSLEQYEESLRRVSYTDYGEQQNLYEQKQVFESYVFYGDAKFSHVLSSSSDILNINFNELYENIDFPETLSNLLALPIKQITEKSVILSDGTQTKEVRYDYANMTENEKINFIQILKPLLWWGE